MKRLCVVAKDVQLITGRSERYSRTIISRVKAANNKLPHQLVTIRELSEYLGLGQEEVESRLR